MLLLVCEVNKATIFPVWKQYWIHSFYVIKRTNLSTIIPFFEIILNLWNCDLVKREKIWLIMICLSAFSKPVFRKWRPDFQIISRCTKSRFRTISKTKHNKKKRWRHLCHIKTCYIKYPFYLSIGNGIKVGFIDRILNIYRIRKIDFIVCKAISVK